MTVTALARGSATVTVTALDPEDLAATGVFGVTVANGGPRVHTPMPGRRLEAGGVIEMSPPGPLFGSRRGLAGSSGPGRPIRRWSRSTWPVAD